MLSAAKLLTHPLPSPVEQKIISKQDKEKLTIGIIGAGGKIGTKVLESLWKNPEKFPNLEKVIALNTLPRVNFGMFLDFSVAFPEKVIYDAKKSSVETILTNDSAKLKDADVIFITAGLWPDEATRQEWAEKDNTGRLVQSSVNFPLIQKICADIKKYASNAIIYMVTNQVDMMTALARRELPKQKILGIGGHIDSMRYKFILANLLFQTGYIDSNNPNRISAHIIGFHNNDMFLLKDSLRIDGERPDWNNPIFTKAADKAIDVTRSFGKTISDLQKHPKRPGIDSGSSFAPAKAITDVMLAICSDNSLTAAFNTVVDEKSANHYGIQAGSALSIPVTINGMTVTPVTSASLKIAESEKEKLHLAQQKLDKDIRTLFELQKNQLATSGSAEESISFTINSSRNALLSSL